MGLMNVIPKNFQATRKWQNGVFSGWELVEGAQLERNREGLGTMFGVISSGNEPSHASTVYKKAIYSSQIRPERWLFLVQSEVTET